MKRLPDLLIIASVLLLVMSMSAFSQDSTKSSPSAGESKEKNELPKLIVRSAARSSWALVRITSKHVVVPATEYSIDTSTEVAPKVTRMAVRGASATASVAVRAGKSGLEYLRVKLSL